MDKISFDVDEYKLDGAVFYPPDPKEKNPAILFVHGWMSSQESALGRAEALSQIGYICLTFSMRGHGESDGDIGKILRKEFINDTLAAYDFLAEQKNVDPENINAVGASFGAYLVSVLTIERKLRNIVLRVPANYPDDGLEKPQFLFSGNDIPAELKPKFTNVKNDTIAINALRQFNGDVMIVESENDEIIPHEMVVAFINSINDRSRIKHILMKGADHSIKDEINRAKYTRILVDWFKTKI
jgi:uncharacterized protein